MVDALCGAEWRALERTGAFQVDLGAALFRSIVSLGVIEMPEDFSAQDISRFEKAFADGPLSVSGSGRFTVCSRSQLRSFRRAGGQALRPLVRLDGILGVHNHL
jgi:hypothetical protein